MQISPNLSHMKRLGEIGEAAKALGVSITTLSRWEAEGNLIPEHTAGKHRRYWPGSSLRGAAPDERRTIAYARVSSHDQKDDFERQKQVLELYCARQGWTFEIVSDLGSDMISRVWPFTVRRWFRGCRDVTGG